MQLLCLRLRLATRRHTAYMTFHDSAGFSPGNRQDKSSWRREGDLKISASLETLENQGRNDVPLPVYPEVYPKSLSWPVDTSSFLIIIEAQQI